MFNTKLQFTVSCKSCGHEETLINEPAFAGHVDNGDIECDKCGALDTVEITSEEILTDVTLTRLPGQDLYPMDQHHRCWILGIMEEDIPF